MDREIKIASHGCWIFRNIKGDVRTPLLLQHLSIRNIFRLYRISPYHWTFAPLPEEMLTVMHLLKFSCHTCTCRKYRFVCRLWATWPIIFLAFCWLLLASKILSSIGRTQDVQGNTTLSFTLPRPIGTDTFLLYFWLANAGIVGLLDFKQIKIIQSLGNQIVVQYTENFL